MAHAEVSPTEDPLPTERTQPRQNHLLAALPEAEWLRWQPLLERVPLPLGKVRYGSGATMGHVYFTTNAIVSLLYVMEVGGTPTFRWTATSR